MGHHPKGMEGLLKKDHRRINRRHHRLDYLKLLATVDLKHRTNHKVQSSKFKVLSDMKRFAFKMYLKKGCEKEYAKRHAAIWPELKQMIKDQGVSDYSIFWDKDTNLLFAVQKCDSDTNSQDTTNVDPITQKWWDMMADIMEVNPDNSPVSIPLEELFHMD